MQKSIGVVVYLFISVHTMFPFLSNKYFSTFGAKSIGQPNQILALKSKVCTIEKETFYIPAWYINKFTIIDFTIYTRLFLVKLKRVVDGPILHSKSVVDGPILHSKSIVDRSILHCQAKVCVFSKI